MTFEMNCVTPSSEDNVLPVPPQEFPVALLCSEDDIIRLFSTLDTTKSTGPDSISALSFLCYISNRLAIAIWYICSVQSGNLRNLEIALRILGTQHYSCCTIGNTPFQHIDFQRYSTTQ